MCTLSKLKIIKLALSLYSSNINKEIVYLWSLQGSFTFFLNSYCVGYTFLIYFFPCSMHSTKVSWWVLGTLQIILKIKMRRALESFYLVITHLMIYEPSNTLKCIHVLRKHLLCFILAEMQTILILNSMRWRHSIYFHIA